MEEGLALFLLCCGKDYLPPMSNFEKLTILGLFFLAISTIVILLIMGEKEKA